MKTTTTEIEVYLAAVREQLDDLPSEEQSDLLEDLAQHLSDVTAHEGDDRPSLEAVLGPPAQYAADLRGAAGLPPRTVAPPSREWESIESALGSSTPGRFGLALWRRREIKAVREFLPLLKPAWWVLRGYLLVALPSLMSADKHDDFPIPSIGSSHLIGLILVAGAIIGSVAVGRRSLGETSRLLVRVTEVCLVILALIVISEAEAGMSPAFVFQFVFRVLSG